MAFTKYYQKNLAKYVKEAEESILHSNRSKKVNVGSWYIKVGYTEDRGQWFFVVPYTVDGEPKEYQCVL